jgi:hypothetical protein
MNQSATLDLGSIIRNAFALIFGPKSFGFIAGSILANRSAFIGTTKRAAEVACSLVSQKDGREFAYDVLEKLDGAAGDLKCCAPINTEAVEGDDMSPPDRYREGPQWDGFYLSLRQVFTQGSVEAQKGFAAVLTDAFGGEVNMDINAYREWEERGLMQDFGRPGSEMNPALGVVPADSKGGTDTTKKPAERTQSKAEAKASKALEVVYPAMLALDDVSRRYGSCGMSVFTLQALVEGSVQQIVCATRKAVSALPEQHPALQHLAAVTPLVAALRRTAQRIAEDNQNIGDFPDAVDGAGMFALVLALGGSYDRALLACGSREALGYHDGTNTDPAHTTQ